jgi:hypothetical protein
VADLEQIIDSNSNVPKEYHKALLGDFMGKPQKVTIEEILED